MKSKKIQTFKTFEANSTPMMTPKEFAQKYDNDYKYVVYQNGKPQSGYEFLSDAFEYIGESIVDILSEDMGDFMETVEQYLQECDISIYEDIDEIEDVEDFESNLNDCLHDCLREYSEEDTNWEEVTIKIV